MNTDILNKSRETKTIKIELSIDEHKKVKEDAKRRGLALREYTKMKILDEDEGIDSIRRYFVCAIPRFNAMVEKIPDVQLRNDFYIWGNELWPYLK
ncbi:MAG: hypothetical protein HFF39_00010 [Lawsonibacter sp.]|nr:hypothetical protein [Lawsonibacter sp.]